MANTIQLKRRVSGNAGAPAALKSGEVAHNEVDNTLYVGKGDDGSGNATSVVPLAGRGAFADLSTSQTIAGAKTFSVAPKSSQDASGSTDLMRKSQVDTLLAGKANSAHGLKGGHKALAGGCRPRPTQAFHCHFCGKEALQADQAEVRFGLLAPHQFLVFLQPECGDDDGIHRLQVQRQLGAERADVSQGMQR